MTKHFGNTDGSGVTGATGTDNLLDLDPLLGPLAGNGGPTLTHLLFPGSPAIDAGNPAAVAGVGGVPLYDQRQFAFSRVVEGRIDMGAVEDGAVSANFDADTDIDGLDFLAWQSGFGTSTPSLNSRETEAAEGREQYALHSGSFSFA